MDLLFESKRIFRICPTDGPRGVYAITSLDLVDTITNRLNDPGAIRSGSVRKGWLYEHLAC
jgi:hypothetical protein